MKSVEKNAQQASQDAMHRFDDAMVDADIESLARSPEIEAELAGWKAEGVSVDQQIERLKLRLAPNGTADPDGR